MQGQTREQLAGAQAQADSLKGQLGVSQAKLQRLDRSNAHLRKQRTQMMADIQVGAALCCAGLSWAVPCCAVLCCAVLLCVVL